MPEPSCLFFIHQMEYPDQVVVIVAAAVFVANIVVVVVRLLLQPASFKHRDITLSV